jgi:hypothetical protein
MHAADRRQLVGLSTVDPAVVLEEGAQVVEQPARAPPMRLIGHVTSSYSSAVLGRSIALALVEGGRSRTGQTLYVPMPHGDIPVTVTQPVFYDAEGNPSPWLMRKRAFPSRSRNRMVACGARCRAVRISWRMRRRGLAVGTALGAPLPRHGRAFAQGPCAALSLGPDEHLFIVAESEVTNVSGGVDSASPACRTRWWTSVTARFHSNYAARAPSGCSPQCAVAARCRGVPGRRMYAHRVR